MKASQLFIAAAALAFSSLASADVVFTSGAVGSAITPSIGVRINHGDSVSNAFTLTNNTNLTSAILAIEHSRGVHATGLTWSIGSQAFGSNYGIGSSELKSTPYSTGVEFLEWASFDLDATLNSGTYWLTLSNVTPGSDDIAWAQTSNAADAYVHEHTGETIYMGKGMYFSLSGDEVAVPEPATVSIMLLGLLGMTAARRRHT